MNDIKTKWYVAIIIMRFEKSSGDKDNMQRRCTVHESFCLIEALTAEEAYEKTMKRGKELEEKEYIDDKNNEGSLLFEGINGLYPVAEPIEDECEILWTKLNCSVKTAKNLVRDKNYWLS